ncbi:DUF4290 domain-containing protein [Flammeovirga yaeyamensis]|uniref:DUF4290 domain-containing protein n=1 Tax=Flammeovirga yaeyamensis TaxID=367791 RepID=A0AAX1N8A9_9BACT|nr:MULTISPECIES: DUF4290 domain-containing protein [Flammeovirga]ANQ48771.1 DUF4290 domain-containing protein [Flammeovirga sp. MY04]MBB3698851.1 hypothetical protein [Flammeovirga yaeyamensis]NMF37436.1 DUF4290 domain-containing protein [Flammeovirga yaeyamensis]QWG03751.1 DUF4290 domain-containing protein [Flammeovirga yaeyamensis]
MQEEFSYNTGRSDIVLKEYGRNVEKLVKYISSLDDKALRTQYAYTLIALMKQLHPIQKQLSDSQQRVWDHLTVMSEFNLDIDAPYPLPTENQMHKKPRKVAYSQTNIRFKHFGKNLQKMVESALEQEGEDKIEEAMVKIIKLMKSFYSMQVNDQIEDEVVINTINTLCKGRFNVRPLKQKYPDAFKNVKIPAGNVLTQGATSTAKSNNSNSSKKKRRRKRK